MSPAREYARIVHEIPPPEQRAELENFKPARWKIELPDFLSLGARLTEAGFDAGDVLTKIDTITVAIDRATAYDPRKYLTHDLLDLGPEVVAERVRQAGVDLALSQDMARARRDFDTRLAHDAAASLRRESDRIIRSMRKTFDPALKIVRAAADAGLTPATDTQTLADTADTKAIDAYRKLNPAVQQLDHIARLRLQMATVARIGPHDYPVASLLASADSMLHLEGAQHLWRGDIETVQYDLPGGLGSHQARVQRPRLGGPWLALIANGYTLRINTGAEADAVLAGARAGADA